MSWFLDDDDDKEINQTKRNALLVIAHPDDEAMFFSPFLLASTTKAWEVSVLCLSTGDFEGLGHVRYQELLASTDVLKVPRERVTVCDDPRLQDGMKNVWTNDAVTEVVIQHVLKEREKWGGSWDHPQTPQVLTTLFLVFLYYNSKTNWCWDQTALSILLQVILKLMLLNRRHFLISLIKFRRLLPKQQNSRFASYLHQSCRANYSVNPLRQ